MMLYQTFHKLEDFALDQLEEVENLRQEQTKQFHQFQQHARAAQEWIPNYPLGRIGTPDDIAYGALFLASDEAAWVSGIDLTMDGGKMAKL